MLNVLSATSASAGVIFGIPLSLISTYFTLRVTKFLPTKYHDLVGIVAAQCLSIACLDDSSFSTGVKISVLGMTIFLSTMEKALQENTTDQEVDAFLKKWRDRNFAVGALVGAIAWPLMGAPFAIPFVALSTYHASSIENVKGIHLFRRA